MQCAEAREQLGAYLDGGLDAEWQRVVEKHVEACDRCRADVDALRETITAVRTLAPVDPPASLRAHVRDRVAAVPAHGTRLTRLVRSTPFRVAATVAAALVLLVGVGSLRRAPVVSRFAAPPVIGLDRSATVGPAPVSIGAPSGPEPAPPFAPFAAVPTTERRVIRQAEMTLETGSLEDAVDEASAVAEQNGGYVEQALTGSDEPRTARLVLRVPADRFDDALEALAKLGQVGHRAVTGRDVTEEYVDLAARVRNLQREEARLLDLYARGDRIPDLLAVEERVAAVREKIERVQGRMQYLDHNADLARIDLDLRERKKQSSLPAWYPRELGRRLLEAIAGTLDRIGSALAGGLVVVAGVLPYGMITGAGWLLARGLRGRSRGQTARANR